MSTHQNTQEQERSFLGMPDEEVLNLDPSIIYADEPEEEVSEGTDVEDIEDNYEDVEDPQEDNEEDVPSEEQDDVYGDGPDEEGSEEPDEEEDQEPESGNEDTDDASEEIDYEAEYKKIFAPFKANGREYKIERAEDAITLMQMGANYNKKMAALKPNLRILKMLEKHQLLDEQKLSYLIDLDKKNPEAISKLIKDSGLDPLDLDDEKASGYQPNTYTVDEREIELDTVIESLRDSPAYPRTVEVVGNKWDAASQRVVAETPQLLRVIHDHIERGIYDIIAAEVEKERMLGRLVGLSDIEAYRQIGDAINAQGGFDHLGRQESTPPTQRKVVPQKSKQQDNAKLRSKKRAASSTRPAAPSRAAQEDFNPLALSDEEFSKIVQDNLL